MLMQHLRVINPVLTNMSIAMRQAKTGFVADLLAPDVPVNGDTGTIPIWEANQHTRIKSSYWAKGAVAPMIGLRASSTTFSVKKYGLSTPIDDDDRQNYLMPGSLDEEATSTLTDLLMLDREKRVYDKVTAIAHDLDLVSGSATQWNEASCVPKVDIQGGIQKIMKATMKIPNVLVLGAPVWDNIMTATTTGYAGQQFAAAFINVMAATGKTLTTERFAEYVGVDRVVVANAIYEAADETTTVVTAGNTTGTYIWGDWGILCYTEPTPQIGSVSFMKSFTSFPMSMLPTYRKDDVEADIYRIKAKWDEKVVAEECVYVIEDMLA